jgi:uncharacterized RDD family membrane protein YckC
MAGIEWFVTLEGDERGPFAPAQVKAMVEAGQIGPMTPIRRGGMARAVAAAQVKGLLPAEMVANSGVGGPASVSGPQRPGTQLTDSGAQRVRGSVPSTRRMAIMTPEPDSSPVPRAQRAAEADTDAPDDIIEDSEDDPGIEARAGFGSRLVATLIDGALLTLVYLILVGGGLGLGTAIHGGTLEQINTERLDDSAAADYEMPFYEKWESELQHVPKPELPGKPEPVEGESEADYAERDTAYRNDYAEISKQREVYNWRQKRYEADRLRVAAAEQQATAMFLIGLALASLLLLVYAPLTEAALGATLGKKLVGLAVVDRDCRRVRLGTSILRQVLRLIPLGQLRALSGDRLALHDKLSGSQVVPQHQVRGGGRTRRVTASRTRRGADAESGATRKRGTARQGRRRR